MFGPIDLDLDVEVIYLSKPWIHDDALLQATNERRLINGWMECDAMPSPKMSI